MPKPTTGSVGSIRNKIRRRREEMANQMERLLGAPGQAIRGPSDKSWQQEYDEVCQEMRNLDLLERTCRDRATRHPGLPEMGGPRTNCTPG